MASFQKQSAEDWLRSAINHALAVGIARREIFTMVATAPPPRLYPHSNSDDDAAWPTDPDRIVYDEVPAGLITLPDAAAKYGVKRGTLNVALFRGMIPRAGRVRGRGHSRGKHVISENALRRYLGLEPDITAADNDEPPAEPKASDNDLPYYDVLPEGLITLSDGARQYNIPPRRIHGWIRRNQLTRVGYLRGRGPQGGQVVIVEAELAALLEGQQPMR